MSTTSEDERHRLSDLMKHRHSDVQMYLRVVESKAQGEKVGRMRKWGDAEICCGGSLEGLVLECTALVLDESHCSGYSMLRRGASIK